MGITGYSNGHVSKPPSERMDIRFVGAIGGCYTLSSRAADDKNARKVFACRTQSISTEGAVLSAPVSGGVGEKLTVKLDEFNIFRGTIARLFPGGFAIDFAVSNEERGEIAAKIGWIKRHRFRSAPDKRAEKRVIPPHPRSVVTLPDGTTKECLIIDVSRSGVAVSADLTLKIGSRVDVGKASGTVARLLNAGFAVRFDQVLDLNDLDTVFAWSPENQSFPAT